MRSHAKAIFTRSTAPIRFGLICLILSGFVSFFAGSAFADGPPIVTIDTPDPTEVTFNSAQLSGSVNPNGHRTEWFFQYLSKKEKEDTGEENWNYVNFDGVIEEPESDGTLPLLVERKVEGLRPGTVYLVRLIASNEAGEATPSAEEEITTDGVKLPAVKDLTVSNISSFAAHFEATLNSGGSGNGEKAGTYSIYCSPACPSAESGETPLPGDGTDQSVEANATDLEPHKVYEVTIKVRNAQSDAADEEIKITKVFETEATGPGAETQELRGLITDTSARVLGTVNPHNSKIQICIFEYGSSVAYGQAVPCDSYENANQELSKRENLRVRKLQEESEEEIIPPCPPGAVSERCIEVDEAGNIAYTVGANLEGLVPNSLYHYRLVVSNGIGASVKGLDHTFATTASRTAQGACPNEEIRLEQNSAYLPECMAYELISPTDSLGSDINGGQGSPDGEHAWINVVTPISETQSTGSSLDFYALRTSTGWQLRDLGKSGTARAGVMVGYGEGGSKAIIKSCLLTLISCLKGPYEYEGIEDAGVRTKLFGFEFAGGGSGAREPNFIGNSADAARVFLEQPAGEPPLLNVDKHAFGRGLYMSSASGLEYLGYDEDGNILPCGAVAADNSSAESARGFEQTGISADGRTVSFESPEPDIAGSEDCPYPTDVYIRRDGESESLNVSRPANGNPNEGARFAGISRDGQIVFFTTASSLVTADTDSNTDLYSYDLTSKTQNLISGGLGVEGNRVAVSPDGDSVYFLSQSAHEGHGVAGSSNLYVYHAGTIHFITTVQAGRELNVGGNPESTDYSPITPNGMHLLFSSNYPLTGQATGRSKEYFSYSVGDGTLICVTCHPDGSLPEGDANITRWMGPGTSETRAQSDDGAAVAFFAKESLVPRDVDHSEDVYLWRQDAPLALITSGHRETESEENGSLRGMSADGRNVFFESYSRLVPSADQSNRKLYVARVGGGFSLPLSPTPCAGEACRAVLPPIPSNPSVGTEAFSGAPNPKYVRKQSKSKKRHHNKFRKRHPKKRFERSSRHGYGTESE